MLRNILCQSYGKQPARLSKFFFPLSNVQSVRTLLSYSTQTQKPSTKQTNKYVNFPRISISRWKLRYLPTNHHVYHSVNDM